MTKQPLVVNSADMIFKLKTIKGFMVMSWFMGLSQEERNIYFEMISADLKEGGKVFGTHFVKTVPLAQWKEAMMESDSVASQGKILINCE